jgi:hypothetical protein
LQGWFTAIPGDNEQVLKKERKNGTPVYALHRKEISVAARLATTASSEKHMNGPSP